MLQDMPIPTPLLRDRRTFALETERLTLRKPAHADARVIAALANDRRIAEMARRLPHPYTLDDAVRFVEAVACDSREMVFLVEHHHVPVGVAGVDWSEPHAPELGYWFGVDYWGRGFATEAARAVIEQGFAAGLPEVYAVVRPGNKASLAVCARLGMAPLGRFRRWYDVELEAFRLMAPAVVE